MVKESFFHQHFEPGSQEKLQSCHWLQLRAANVLTIPYNDYVELIVELCGKKAALWGIGGQGSPRWGSSGPWSLGDEYHSPVLQRPLWAA